MFQALQTLLAACAMLKVSMVANANGTITVTVIPIANKGGDDNVKLNTPLSLTGTAEELDEQFAVLLAQYTDTRKSLAEQLEATQAIMEAAKKEATTKATKAIKGTGGGKTAAGASEEAAPEGGEDDDTPDGGEAKATPASGSDASAGTPAAAPAAADNVWG